MSQTVSIPEQKAGQLIPTDIIESIIYAIVDHFSPLEVILFGSYASGDPTSDSDLDLLVVMETDLPSHKRATPIRLLFRPMPCPMDILVYTPEEVNKWKATINHIIAEAFRSGRIVYERK